MNKNNNNNKTSRAVLAVVMVVVLLATLTLTAGAYVDGTGTETDVQASQYMVYYPFSVSAYANSMRTLSYAVDTFYTLGSLGADENIPNSNVVQTGTPVGDFVLFYFEDTDNFEFRLVPTYDTDMIDGGGTMNMATQVYITGIGYDRVHGNNLGRLNVEVDQDFYDEGYLYIDYYTLDGSGNVRQAEYESYTPFFEVNDILEELCGDYLAVYVNELSYEVTYQFPQEYPSEYQNMLKIYGNGYRTASDIMHSSNAGVKNGAWWGSLISGFRDITDYSFGDWITTAFGGFFGTELFGLFSLGDILLWVLGIGLVVVFIKMFAGG